MLQCHILFYIPKGDLSQHIVSTVMLLHTARHQNRSHVTRNTFMFHTLPHEVAEYYPEINGEYTEDETERAFSLGYSLPDIGWEVDWMVRWLAG